MKVIKRDGKKVKFDESKIKNALIKAFNACNINDKEAINKVFSFIEFDSKKNITVEQIQDIVEEALMKAGYYNVAKAYVKYRYERQLQRNNDLISIVDATEAKAQELEEESDRSNANCDSQLVSTKRILKYGAYQKEKYNKFFLTKEEKKANDEGFIYIHDMKDRWDTYNCCLLNVGRILKDGFTLANITYTEPGSVAAAIAVASDVISVTAGNQYGGLTWPNVDEDLAPYCEKSYQFYIKQHKDEIDRSRNWVERFYAKLFKKEADKIQNEEYAIDRVKREIEQGYQGIEHTYNSVSSCRKSHCGPIK